LFIEGYAHIQVHNGIHGSPSRSNIGNDPDIATVCRNHHPRTVTPLLFFIPARFTINIPVSAYFLADLNRSGMYLALSHFCFQHHWRSFFLHRLSGRSTDNGGESNSKIVSPPRLLGA
jgi:hypothetical protein